MKIKSTILLLLPTHITSKEVTGEKGVADKLLEFIKEDNVKLLGGESNNTNTGWQDGSIHHIEVGFERKLLWDICQLYNAHK